MCKFSRLLHCLTINTRQQLYNFTKVWFLLHYERFRTFSHLFLFTNSTLASKLLNEPSASETAQLQCCRFQRPSLPLSQTYAAITSQLFTSWEFNQHWGEANWQLQPFSMQTISLAGPVPWYMISAICNCETDIAVIEMIFHWSVYGRDGSLAWKYITLRSNKTVVCKTKPQGTLDTWQKSHKAWMNSPCRK